MNSPALETSRPQVYAGADPQRLAWGVLLMAFAIFCILCVVLGLTINYFLFQSSFPLEAQLVVGRGSAGIFEASSERLAYDRASITSNARVSTVPQSQATLFFFNDLLDSNVIAHVTLKGSSSARLRSASRPRFEWSTTNYVIDLYSASGEFDIVVSDSVDRNILVYLQTEAGTKPRVNLQGAGHYIVDASDSLVRVFNLRGNAFLIPDETHGYSIPAGQQGVFYAEDSRVELLPGYTNLLRNSNFEILSENIHPGSELLSGWVCSNDPGDNPPGSYRSQLHEGRMSLRLERHQDATSHGRTFCSQTFGSNPLDMRAANVDYLALRANFYIHHQSLGVCGFKGSECPLMLRIDYVDARGEPRQWIHGFYSKMDPQMTYPLRCASCAQEHEFINGSSWYLYDSGNLLALFPEEQQIRSIIGIWFYASGHEYDVQISEISLLGQVAQVGLLPAP